MHSVKRKSSQKVLCAKSGYSTNKEFVLSDRIWDVSDNNYKKIKEIIASGINTDCVKVSKALQQYVKHSAETFAKDYSAPYERMGEVRLMRRIFRW